MAQRVQVLLVCDLHDDDTEGTETIRFSLDGAAYEIDLCASHAAQLCGTARHRVRRSACVPHTATPQDTIRSDCGHMRMPARPRCAAWRRAAQRACLWRCHHHQQQLRL